MSDKKPIPANVLAYMRKIGKKGGQIGGAKKGLCKARSPDHYKRMVEARAVARAARKAAAIEAASHVYVVGTHKALLAPEPEPVPVAPVVVPPEPPKSMFAPPKAFVFDAN